MCEFPPAFDRASSSKWIFTRLAEEAGAPDPVTLRRQLHLMYDGAGISARMDRDPSIAVGARAAAAALLKTALRSHDTS